RGGIGRRMNPPPRGPDPDLSPGLRNEPICRYFLSQKEIGRLRAMSFVFKDRDVRRRDEANDRRTSPEKRTQSRPRRADKTKPMTPPALSRTPDITRSGPDRPGRPKSGH